MTALAVALALATSGCFQTRYIDTIPCEFATRPATGPEVVAALPTARRLVAEKFGVKVDHVWSELGRWGLVRHPANGLLLRRTMPIGFAGHATADECFVSSGELVQERIGDDWGPVTLARWGSLPHQVFPDIVRHNDAVPFNPFIATCEAPAHVKAANLADPNSFDCASLSTLP